MKSQEKTYFPNLDATRFFAFLPVFFTHVFFSHNPKIINTVAYQFIENHMRVGILGLDYFFVLSSFLITWIILEEWQNTNQFNFKNYFIRRSLRIWPLYFLIVGITYFVAGFLTSTALPPLSVFLFFIANFYIVKHGDAFLFLLVILWSVSVEEQFYLVWALLLKVLKKYLIPIALLFLVISVVFRWTAINHQKELYFHTLSTLANFAIGAIVASISFNKTKLFYFLKSISRAQIGSIYFLFFLNVIFYKDLYASPSMQIFERLIFSLFFGFIIFEQAFSEVPFINMGKWKLSNYFGHASFGLYCYHGIVITLFIKVSEHFAWDFSLFQVTFLNPVLLLSATMGITYLSYEFLEKRILKYKKQFYSLKAN